MVYFARFFWNNKEIGGSKHWAVWHDVSLPKEEGGLGFRSLFDVSKAMFAKLWWNFRTGRSLWANFMWNKYCKKEIPTVMLWKKGSQVWKYMLENRAELEKHIWWEPRGGTTNIWYENWTKLGPLYQDPECHIHPEAVDICELMNEEGWDLGRLQQILPARVMEHIGVHMGNFIPSNLSDRPWWLLSSTGKFKISSAWELLRHKKEVNVQYNQVWVKGLPFKFGFLAWRIWGNKLPVATTIANWDGSVNPNCSCCTVSLPETVQHLFLSGEMAKKVWLYFASAAGIQGPLIQIKQTVQKWRDAQGNEKFKSVMGAVPIIILWFLWKSRNTILHGGLYAFEKIILDANDTIQKFIITRFPCFQNLPKNWPHIVEVLESWRPSYNYRMVRWLHPPPGWYKCNTDGASKGNPGPSSAAFCVRNSKGDIVVFKGRSLSISTNIVAEAVAIREGIHFCIERNLMPLIVETDSLSMKNFIDGNWEVPWSVVMEVEAINRMRKDVPIHVKHILESAILIL